MHFRAITRIVGLLVILFSGTMFIPGVVALIYRDGAGRAFSETFFCCLGNRPFTVATEPKTEA